MDDFVARDLTPRIGSAIAIGRAALLDGTHAPALRALVIARGVLVIRDCPLDEAEQHRITARFGPVREGLQQVTIDPEVSAEYAAYFANTLFWHMDGYHDQTVPCFGGSFRPVRLAPAGGETEFLNTYAAYAALGADDRALVDGLCVFHSALTSGLAGNPQASDAQIAAWRRRPPARQPLVWQHADGRKSLMLGVAVSHVEGLHPADSYDLLLRLRAHLNRDEFIYRHRWRMDDLVIWNNTGTMHRARPFDPGCGRLLHRFTLEGTEAIRAPAS